jgi:hypothetical protein
MNHIANCPDYWEEMGMGVVCKAIASVPDARVHVCNVSSVAVFSHI